MRISIILCASAILIPRQAMSQKKAEFESNFTMVNAQERIVKFTIGFDRNAYEAFEDTLFGEYDLNRLHQGGYYFRDSFDIVMHPNNVVSFDKSIIRSPKCGEYEYGALQLIVKVNTYMFPLRLKWDKSDFKGLCVARSLFEPNVHDPQRLFLLKNLDSLIITNEMAKSIAVHPNKFNEIDTIRFMYLLFQAQGAAASDDKEKTNPRINYKKGGLILSNVDLFDQMNVYSLDGRLLRTHRLPSTHPGEITIPWIPPVPSVYLISLTGPRSFESFKVYCH